MKSATADLFAGNAPSALVPSAPPAPSPPSEPALPTPAPPCELVTAAPPREAPARSREKHLWYAAVFPELQAHQAATVLQRLCLHAQQFTPLVSLEMPNALLLEIRGSVKLFGCLEDLHASIDAAWSGLKLRARSATAPSTLAALWLARGGEQVRIEDPRLLAGALAQLPIACTSWDAERLQTLRAMGVTRIGELLRLPRAGVARRFSPATLREMDIALARQAAPRRIFEPRERFRERCDFETEIETVAYLQKALEPFCDRCAQFLRNRQAGVQALELTLRHRVLPVTRVRLGLASITGEQRRLTEVLTQKLSRLELAAPVRGMQLLSGPLQPLSAASLDVFAPRGIGGGRDTAPRLVERLRARLGEAAVYGICSIPEHRPEAAWQRVHELHLDAAASKPAVRGRAASNPGAHMDDLCMPRPVWLLDAPVILTASQVQQLQQGDLRLELGPERIESGWWDGKGIARDYYIARQAGGARLWVFQERQSQGWYLHGVFA